MNYVCYIFVYLEKKSKFLVLETKRFFFFYFFRSTRGFSSLLRIPGAMRKSDLRGSLGRKQLVCWVDFISSKDLFQLHEKEVVKALDPETTFNLKKIVERIA